MISSSQLWQVEDEDILTLTYHLPSRDPCGKGISIQIYGSWIQIYGSWNEWHCRIAAGAWIEVGVTEGFDL